jgi:peptidoglycan/xylan/chitin deacetylase (PgdA/CDA1 family)
MMALFARCRVPLSLAVVPAWVTPERWRAISTAAPIPPELLCWHQHGWRHVNHEPRGKKQEFGPARAYAAIQRDIQRGKARLETIIGRHFYPVFTPPWNRCSPDTLRIIQDLGYRAVSRSHPAPPPPDGLTDFAVNLDLHTRKDGGGRRGWAHLLQDVENSLSGGRCGIMLHHRRMNDAAFDFLVILLEILVAHPRIRLVNFKHLPANAVTG